VRLLPNPLSQSLILLSVIFINQTQLRIRLRESHYLKGDFWSAGKSLVEFALRNAVLVALSLGLAIATDENSVLSNLLV
jgi:hypothetical protein